MYNLYKYLQHVSWKTMSMMNDMVFNPLTLSTHAISDHKQWHRYDTYVCIYVYAYIYIHQYKGLDGKW